MFICDRQPLRDTPVTARIAALHNNRLGAIYSSLYAFWSARYATRGGTANRGDTYSIILFDDHPTTMVSNDIGSTPDDLLSRILTYSAMHGTNFNEALQAAQACMDSHWASERRV